MTNESSDANIRRAILVALEGDERISSQPVGVQVRGGRVILSGQVQSFRRKLAAHELAAEVAGEAAIENRLEVSIPEIPADEEIADEIRALLERDERLVTHALVVEVRAGRVTLSGSVANEGERALVEDIALQACGAREVVNQLAIGRAARIESVVVALELEHELATDPRLCGCQLSVAISGDVAVLAGTAGSQTQVEAAVAHVRRLWVGELRQEVTLPD